MKALMVCGLTLMAITMLGISGLFWMWFLTMASLR